MNLFFCELKYIFKYLNVHPTRREKLTEVQDLLRNHSVTGNNNPPSTSLESFSSELLPLTFEKQFDILSCIPNNHWWQYITANGGLSVDDVSHLGFYQHLAFRPSAVLESHLFEESDHCTSSWRMPTSALLYF